MESQDRDTATSLLTCPSLHKIIKAVKELQDDQAQVFAPTSLLQGSSEAPIPISNATFPQEKRETCFRVTLGCQGVHWAAEELPLQCPPISSIVFSPSQELPA